MIFKKIQILRALAANAVVLSHLFVIEQKYGHGFDLLPAWIHFGSSGVDLFFIISGFIMASLTRETSWKDFITARVTRIYPPYWFYTTIVLILWLVAPGMVNNSYDHAPSMWRSYLLFPDTTNPLLAVGWTLVHEMYFYIVFTIILFARVRLMPALAAWSATVIIFSFLLPNINRETQPVLYVLFNPLTMEFIAGAVIGLAIKSGISKHGWWALGVGAGLFLFNCIASNETASLIDVADWHHIFAFGPPFALIVYGAAACEKRGWQPPQSIVALGNASYSTYLSHVLVLSAIGHVFVVQPLHNFPVEVVFVIAGIAVVNIWALISFRLIEKPSLLLTRHVIERFRFKA